MANWIANATKNSHGQFKNKAKAAGMSTRAYANRMKGKKGVTAKQAQLAANLMNLNKKKAAPAEVETPAEDAGELKEE